MSNPFKIGDKVRLKETNDGKHRSTLDYVLEHDTEYTVIAVNGPSSIRLAESAAPGWSVDRFELAPRTRKSEWRDLEDVAYIGIGRAGQNDRLDQPWNYTPEFFKRVGLELRVQVRTKR